MYRSVLVGGMSDLMGCDKRFVMIGVLPESLLNFRGELLSALVECNFEVTACSFKASGYVKNELAKIGVKHEDIIVKRTGINPFFDLLTLLDIRRLLKEIKPTHALFYTIKPVIYGGIAAQGLKIKVFSLITGIGFIYTGNSYFQKILKSIANKLYKIALKSNKAIIFQNQDDQNIFNKNKLMPHSVKTSIVNGSGVDTDYFKPVALPDELVFLLIARLIKTKGIFEYAEAAREVKKQFPECRFLVAGRFDTNPLSISKNTIKQWHNEGVIEYQGYIKDVRQVISKARVYVLPSYREGTPRTVLEAMSMGRPIITTDAPGCRDTIENGINGLLVPTKNVKKLTEAMTYMIKNPKKVNAMAKQSRKRATMYYNVHDVNKKMMRIMGIVN